MWVRRASVFLVGLSVILALLFGEASTAALVLALLLAQGLVRVSQS
jgi:hypothetical protein